MESSQRLSEEEKAEMMADAKNPIRKECFARARQSTQVMTLEEYIDFISVNRDIAPVAPRPKPINN